MNWAIDAKAIVRTRITAIVVFGRVTDASVRALNGFSMDYTPHNEV